MKIQALKFGQSVKIGNSEQLYVTNQKFIISTNGTFFYIKDKKMPEKITAVAYSNIAYIQLEDGSDEPSTGSSNSDIKGTGKSGSKAK